MNIKLKEKPARPARKGVDPLHERAVRLQGEARKQDGPCFPGEETQGDDQLRRQGDVTVAVAQLPGQRWADPPGPDLHGGAGSYS